MRKLLCGIAAGAFVLALFAGPAGAAEAKGAISKSDAAHQIEETAKSAGLDAKVVECVKNAAANNNTDRCVEAPSPIAPATNELVYGGLAFIVLLVVLWKFAYPAIAGMMNARTERIRTSIDDADKAKGEAETVLADYQRQLTEARAEASRIIEDARVQADQVKRELIAKAEADAVELRQRNAEQVAGERDRVLGEIQGQVATLAIELAEKVVESNLDREANTRLIESYISSVGSR